MDAYSLPWFDPLEEAEARAEAVADGLRAGAGSSMIYMSGRTYENSSVAPTNNPVDSFRAPLTLSCVQTTTSVVGGAL